MIRLIPISTAILLAMTACISVWAIPLLPEKKEPVDTPFMIARRAEEKTRAKEWKAAAELWTQAVEANPVNGLYWDRLGLARYSNKEYARAIPAYEKVLELGEGYPFNAAYN